MLKHVTARLRRWSLGAMLAAGLVTGMGCGEEQDGTTLPQRGATVAIPNVEGPVTGGAGVPFVASTTFDLGEVGYSQSEYFISGTAKAYTTVGPVEADGLWTVTRGQQAAYKTRIVVYRPIDRKQFNGTVIVEWLNVSGGLDAAADWIMGHTEMTREGYAWVGVSAQKVGVEGGDPIIMGLPILPLKTADPVRYASLFHPGDSFSYDIYSQVAQSMRRPTGVNPLGGLEVEKIIAVGESQSAFRMVNYIDAIHPVADIYDGFLVHSRGSFGAALSEPPQPSINPPGNARIRADLNVPVLTLEAETDLSFLGYTNARQDDSDNFRLWEVAGTAHADTYTTINGATDRGDSPEVANLIVATEVVLGISCPRPINSGPHHWVLKAGIAALNRWVRDGIPPASAPRLETNTIGRILRDVHGNALGGIRTPQVDVPIATLSGDGQSGSLFCILFGTTVPFEVAKLVTLYPNHQAYVSAFNAATDAAVAAGHILPPDAELMKTAAADSSIGNYAD